MSETSAEHPEACESSAAIGEPREPIPSTIASSEDSVSHLSRLESTASADHPAAIEAERVRRRLQARMFGVTAPAIRIGRFEILGRIGHGAHGEVFKARDLRVGRTVALKLLFRPVDEDAEEIRAEGRALAALSHPNVVTVFDAGIVAVPLTSTVKRYFIAMERIDGQPADRFCEAVARSWEEVLAIYLGAGEGLAAAHAAGLVHGDFKPHNVIVDDDGRARVLDFGLALRSGDVKIARPRGTPGYMAPEAREGRFDVRSDQFSFCAALWEALGGRLVDVSPTLDLVSESPTEIEPDAPRVEPQAPARIVDTLARGLDPDPERRWPSMEVVLDRLRTRPRRRRAGWLLLSASAAAAVGLWIMLDETSACDDGPESFHGLWDRPRIEQLRGRFEDSGLRYARDAWRTVERRVDDYVDEWVEARRRVCQEARGGDAEDRIDGDRRRECLHERRRALATILDAVAIADTSVIRDVSGMVAELPAIAPCLQLRDDPLQPRSADAERVAQARAKLLSSRELSRRKEHDAAIERARTVLEVAEALDFPPLRVEALLQLGRAQMDAERDGAEALESAMWEAHALDHGEVEAEAAWLLSIHFMNRGDLGDAARFMRQAEVVARRHGDESRLANVLIRASTLEHRRSRYDEAMEYLEQAAAVLETHPHSEFEQARLYRQIGIVRSRQGDLVASRVALSTSVDMAEAHLGPAHPELAVYLQSLGMVLEQSDELDEARRVLERGLEIHDTERSSIALRNSLGIVLERKGHFEEAAQHYEEARAEVEARYGSDHHMGATLDINLGSLMLALERLEEALVYYHRAAVYYDAIGEDGRWGLIFARHGEGEVLGKLGRHREAIEHLDAAIELGEAIGFTPAAVAVYRMHRAFSRFALGAPWVDIHHEMADLEQLFHTAGPGHEEYRDVHQWLAEHPEPPR